MRNRNPKPSQYEDSSVTKLHGAGDMIARRSAPTSSVMDARRALRLFAIMAARGGVAGDSGTGDVERESAAPSFEPTPALLSFSFASAARTDSLFSRIFARECLSSIAVRLSDLGWPPQSHGLINRFVSN